MTLLTLITSSGRMLQKVTTRLHRKFSLWLAMIQSLNKLSVWPFNWLFWLPGVQVWNEDFFLRNHVKFGTMINNALFKVCSIACYIFFPSFGQFVNTMSVTIISFCCKPFAEPFFHIFVRTKVTHCKQVVIERGQIWWRSHMG